MDRRDVAIATITWARSDAEEQLLRRSLERLAAAGFAVAVADTGWRPSFTTFLGGLPRFSVAVPSTRGLVAQVKASLAVAARFDTRFTLYAEPDKEGFFGEAMADFVRRAPADPDAGVVIASRSDGALATFPPMQQYTESVVNRLCRDLLGPAGDYCYGPFLIARALLPDLEQLDDDLGWGWRPAAFSLARRRGLRIDHLTGPYVCPPDQRVEDEAERLHRIRQLAENIRGLLARDTKARVFKRSAADLTRAATHRPIMVEEVLRCLRPAPGDLAVDCTLGGGGHAQAILERIQPGGRLIGLDVDPLELPGTEARLRAAGFGPDAFVARHGNFANLAEVLAAEHLRAVNVVLADLGVAAMQADNPERGFSYKQAGPLDMRMDPSRGETAAQLLAAISEADLASLLTEHADEPQAQVIAALLKRQPLDTTHAVERTVRTGLSAARPQLTKAEVKMSVRRTFQALRIAVNDEFHALDALLGCLPHCLAPGGRVVVLTFHSGEDRRVKKAFQAGHRAGIYSAIANEVVRSTKVETFANRRASAAKLRWAVKR